MESLMVDDGGNRLCVKHFAKGRQPENLSSKVLNCVENRYFEFDLCKIYI